MTWLLLGILLALSPSCVWAQTASPNLNDQQLLASDPTYQNRVRESLISYCIFIDGETVLNGLNGLSPFELHIKRVNYCAAVMGNPDNYKQIFAEASATNGTVIGDATQSGSVSLTSANVATQATKVLDPDLNNAVSSVFNTFLTVP